MKKEQSFKFPTRVEEGEQGCESSSVGFHKWLIMFLSQVSKEKSSVSGWSILMAQMSFKTICSHSRLIRMSSDQQWKTQFNPSLGLVSVQELALTKTP